MTVHEVSESESATPSGPEVEDLPLLAEAFGLGEVQRAAFLAEGIMNRNWRLETAAGPYALKLLCDVPADVARRNADVLTGVAAAGLPVCSPVRTRDGQSVLQLGSRNYLVSPWATGSHREGTELALAEVESFGALVAAIHDALHSQSGMTLPPADRRPWAKVTNPEAAIAKADRLLASIASIGDPTAFDDLARDLLEERKILIDKHRMGAPAAVEAPGPFGWTHGDLQYRNILREGGAVTAVLDWDRIAVKPLGEEVARTAQVQFGGEHGSLDLERVAAFVAGYRTVRTLPAADLADAVDRRSTVVEAHVRLLDLRVPLRSRRPWARRADGAE